MNETSRWGRYSLVVAAESDVRGYVRECLRARSDLRVLDAATTAAAITFAVRESPDLPIVDEPEREILVHSSQASAIVIVDDVPYGAPAGERVRLLGRPLSAEQLTAVIDRIT